MQELVILKRQNRSDVPVTTSKVIAEGTKNTHRSVYLLVDRYENDFKELGVLSFEMTKLENEKGGRPEKIYYLNEDQALLLITYLRNNGIVRKLKIALIKEFSAMKKMLQEKQTQNWQESRQEGKLSQAELGDTIKETAQGSKSPKMYYKHFNSLANLVIGIQDGKRDLSEARKLQLQTTVIEIIRDTLICAMTLGLPYKEAYQDCKAKVNGFMSYVPALRKIS